MYVVKRYSKIDASLVEVWQKFDYKHNADEYAAELNAHHDDWFFVEWEDE